MPNVVCGLDRTLRREGPGRALPDYAPSPLWSAGRFSFAPRQGMRCPCETLLLLLLLLRFCDSRATHAVPAYGAAITMSSVSLLFVAQQHSKAHAGPPLRCARRSPPPPPAVTVSPADRCCPPPKALQPVCTRHPNAGDRFSNHWGNAFPPPPL